jgi:hypothetical protein
VHKVYRLMKRRYVQSKIGRADASQGAGHANHTHGNGAEFAQDPLSLINYDNQTPSPF